MWILLCVQKSNTNIHLSDPAMTAGFLFCRIRAVHLQAKNTGNMFDMMKMMGKLGEVKTRMAEAQEAISKMEVSGEAGAGMVKARMNGARKLIGLDIDPSLLNAQDAEMLRDLVIAAVNNAATRMEELSKEEMKKKTEGLLPNIPGLDLGAFGI